MDTALDRYWMQYCLKLARATPRPAPNPRVGAVVVNGQTVVGRGAHPGAGHPHAEVFALREAGQRAQGATLYVTLEPCNHFGRTPPCTEAVIAAGVGRVVVGMRDPNPLVAGRGLARLEAAGIPVTVGIEEAACQELNEGFGFAIVQQQCFGVLKYAMTCDGKIATVTGDSQWISSEPARRWVHQQRGLMDAVIVGSGTVWRDNPQLTCRIPGWQGQQPRRVVLSRRLDLPMQAHLWDTAVAPTVVFTEANADHPHWQFLAAQGVELITIPELTPALAAQALYQQGSLSALWECGGTLAAAALHSGAIQKVAAFIAPKLVGGSLAPGPVGGEGIPHLSAAWHLERCQGQQIGPDWLVTGYLDNSRD